MTKAHPGGEGKKVSVDLGRDIEGRCHYGVPGRLSVYNWVFLGYHLKAKRSWWKTKKIAKNCEYRVCPDKGSRKDLWRLYLSFFSFIVSIPANRMVLFPEFYRNESSDRDKALFVVSVELKDSVYEWGMDGLRRCFR